MRDEIPAAISIANINSRVAPPPNVKVKDAGRASPFARIASIKGNIWQWWRYYTIA